MSNEELEKSTGDEKPQDFKEPETSVTIDQDRKKYERWQYRNLRQVLSMGHTIPKEWERTCYEAKAMESEHVLWLKNLKSRDAIGSQLAKLSEMSEQEYNQQTVGLAEKIYTFFYDKEHKPFHNKEYKPPKKQNIPAVNAKLANAESSETQYLYFVIQSGKEEPEIFSWLEQGCAFSNFSADELAFVDTVAVKGIVENEIDEIKKREGNMNHVNEEDKEGTARNRKFLEDMGIDIEEPKFFSDTEEKTVS